MKWAALRSGARLGIDWSSHLQKRLDPYLVWADVTDFKGVKSAASEATRPADSVRLAFELAQGTDGTVAGISTRIIVDRPGKRFATAQVPFGQVKKLLESEAVRRLELGFAGHGLKGEPPAAATPGGSIPQIDGPVVAVIDFGCAFAHERFRNRHAGSWRTRIAYMWDQSKQPDGQWQAIAGFNYGRELTGAAIDRLIAANTTNGKVDEDAVYIHADYNSVSTILAHGTHVLDLAAGAPPGSDPALAPKIIFVQLPSYAVEDTSGGSMVPHVMDALAYIQGRVAPGMPIVVNLSYGSMAGPHDGSTILESTIDAVLEQSMSPLQSEHPARDLYVVLPAGNNFESDGHGVLILDYEHPTRTLEWQVFPGDTTDTFLELWYPSHAAGHIHFEIQPPTGPSRLIRVDEGFLLAPENVNEPVAAGLHLREASSGRKSSMMLVALAPTASSWTGERSLAPSGIWRVKATLVGEASGPVTIDAWVERDDPPIGSHAPRQSRLLTGSLPLSVNVPSPRDSLVQRKGTCSSIANGTRTVIVGGCLAAPDAIRFSRYSSSGPTRNRERLQWPDCVVCADDSPSLRGVIAAGTRSGASVRMNGTSVAAPQVARWWIERFLPYPPPVGGGSGPVRSQTTLETPGHPDKARAGWGRLMRRSRNAGAKE